MPETEAILKHTDPTVGKWAVPVPTGRTAQDVADAHAYAGWYLDRAADAADPVSADPDTEYPAANASKADWVAFAVDHAADAVEMEALTRNGIRDLYLPAEPASD